MTTFFNGREFAREKEIEIKEEVADLKKKGVTPKLVSILVGDNPGSILYTSLKKKAAERIGAELQVISLSQSLSPEKIIKTIQKYNSDKKVHGIMVQMPLPKEIVNYKLSIINSIAPEKDVDGLRENSPFVPATVKAILQILEVSSIKYQVSKPKVVVVGAEGMVGKPLVKELRRINYEVKGVDLATSYQLQTTKAADVLISATGVAGLIKGDMLKEGAVVIDVGSPKGDIKFDEVSKKASFITPVPGGVGPVTISCLLENLIEAATI